MENPNGPVVVNAPASSNGVGGKVAIVIILLVLVLAAWYFFRGQDVAETVNQNNGSQTTDTNELNNELDAAANVNVDADLRQMDEEFSQ